MRARYIAVLLAIAGMFLSPVVATAATPQAQQSTVSASAQQAPPNLATATSTTKRCVTSSRPEEADSMYVTRSWTGSTYKYYVEHSPNRRTYYETATTTRYWDHVARWLHVYWSSSSVSSYSYPASPMTFYNKSSGVDFRYVAQLSDGVVTTTRICDIYF